MSLKAKVEAVVYAAEEPVTLAQLASIFSGEVLNELDELNALAAAAMESPEAAKNSEPEESEGVETSPWADPPPPAEPTTEEPHLSAIPETAAPGGGEDTSTTASSAEAEEKRAARRRDRAVREALQEILKGLIEEYANGERGMEIREIAGGYRMATKPEYHDAVRGFVKSLKPPMKLSLQALETLAVIAYKQPVTGPEVSEIRGVDSGGVLGSLIGRKLIATAGRKQVIGRPILYKTTKEFLLRFGLKDVNELPSMEEFEKMAGELAEAEAEAEDAAMRSSDPLSGDTLPSDNSGLAETETEDAAFAANAGQEIEPSADEDPQSLPEPSSGADTPSNSPSATDEEGPQA